MSQTIRTISDLASASTSESNDLFAVTQGSTGPGTGVTVKITKEVVFTNIAEMSVNPFPTSDAPAYTSGYTSELSVANSQYGVADQWPILDGGTNHDEISAVARIIPSTTVTQVNAIAGYADNANSNNVGSSVGVGVAVGAFGINRVDGAQTWLFDGILTDTGSSGPSGRLMQSELDYKPGFTNTQVNGLLVVYDSAIQTTVADAIIAGSGPTSVGKWNNGFRTYPGQVRNAVFAGCAVAGSPANSNSAPIVMEGIDSGGVSRLARLIVEGSATSLVIDRDDGGIMNLVLTKGTVNLLSGKSYNVNGSLIISDRQQGWTAGTGASPNKGAIDYGTATLAQLAARVMALEQALFAGVGPHGLIGT